MYGRDRYVLTNSASDPAESWALELNTRATTERVTLLAGIALTWANASAAAIGFLPTENDQNVLGNLFVDANRDTYARGQLFQDRSHVAKLAAIYRFAGGLTVGALARYLDGQPFGRLVAVNDGLTQGPTLVRAYRNGGSAFTYTGHVGRPRPARVSGWPCHADCRLRRLQPAWPAERSHRVRRRRAAFPGADRDPAAPHRTGERSRRLLSGAEHSRDIVSGRSGCHSRRLA